jgi:hypothetical protein
MKKAQIKRAPGDISNKVLAATLIQLIAAVAVAAIGDGWGAPSTVAAVNAVVTFVVSYALKETLGAGGEIVVPTDPINEVDPEDYGV